MKTSLSKRTRNRNRSFKLLLSRQQEVDRQFQLETLEQSLETFEQPILNLSF